MLKTVSAALGLIVALAPASAQEPSRPLVVVGAAARPAAALILVRIALPPGGHERVGRVDDLRELARGYVAARRGLVLAGTPDVAAGEVEPTREELRRAARRSGAREVVIVSVDEYRGCGSLSLPVPVIATYGRAALRLERSDAASGRTLHSAAALRHVGGAFARLDAAQRAQLFASTLDQLWSGTTQDDAVAREGFERTCSNAGS